MSTPIADILMKRSSFRLGASSSVIHAWFDRLLSMCWATKLTALPLDPSTREIDIITTTTLLRQHGWLLSTADVMRLLSAGTATRHAPFSSLTTVGVIANHRPNHLRRALVSAVRTRRRFARSYRVVVIDDTRDHHVARQIAALVEHVSRKRRADVAYVGASRKRERARTLVAMTGVDERTVAFGMFGDGIPAPTYGANLNCLMLESAGEVVAGLDDDVRWRVGTVGQVTAEAILSNDPDPTQFHFFATRNEVMQAIAWMPEIDPAALFEGTVGCPLPDIVARYRLDNFKCCGSITPRTVRNALLTTGRIIASTLGIAGDSGMWSPHNLPLLRGASRHRLANAYQIAAESREVTRVAHAATVTEGGVFMSAAAAYDNRAVLPPFLPGFRNMESVWSVCTNVCMPSTYLMFLPWLVPHCPTPRGAYERDAIWRNAAATRICDLVEVCIGTAVLPQGSGSDEDRLTSLGMHLEQIGHMSLPLFRDFVQWGWSTLLMRRLDRLGRELEEHHESSRELENCLKRQWVTTVEALRNARDTPPRDVVGDGRDATESWLLTKTMVVRFGEVLRAWPTLWRAAEALNRPERSPSP